MKRLLLLLFSSITLVLPGCISKKVLNEGEYLLKKQKIQGNKEISGWTLEELYQQTPNRKFLLPEFRPYLWAYYYGRKIHDTTKVKKQITKTRNKYDKKIQKKQGDSSKVHQLREKKEKKLNKLQTKLKEGNWLMRSVGEPPVLYDSSKARETRRQMELYLESKGHFRSSVTLETDTQKRVIDKLIPNKILGLRIQNERKPFIKPVYTIKEGEPYKIKRITYSIKDPTINTIVQEHKKNSKIKEEEVYDEDNISAERDRLYNLLKNHGYYDFNRQYIYFNADTSASTGEIDMEIVIRNPGKDQQHQQYRVKRVFFKTNINSNRKDTTAYKDIHFIGAREFLSKKILYHKVAIYKDSLYSLKKTHQTQRKLANLEYFKFINVYYEKRHNDSASNTLNAYIKTSPMKKYQITDEWGVNISTRGENLPGPFGYITFTNRNVFGGFQNFETSIRGGIENVSAATENQSFRSKEFGGNMSLTFPVLLLPWNMNYRLEKEVPKTSISTGYSFVDRPEFSRQNFNTNFNYSWRQNDFVRYNFTPLDLNIVNTTDLSQQFEEYLSNLRRQGNNLQLSFDRSIISSFMLSRTFNNNQFNSRENSRYLSIQGESGGSVVHFINKQFGKEANGNFLGLRNFRYAKFFGDTRFYRYQSKHSSFAFRFSTGIAVPYGNSDALPYEKYFFAGGSNSIRAWKPRRLGPGAYTPPRKNEGGFDYRFEQPGEIILETNLEYRFKMFSFFHGAFFLDAGNVWSIDQDNSRPGAKIDQDFFNEIAVGTGYGLRLDFSFLILRLDLGYKLWDPARPLNERFIGDKGPFSPENPLVLNLGIGHPF